MALTSAERTQHCVSCFFGIIPLARTLGNSFLGQAKESTLWRPSLVIKARYVWKPHNSWSTHTTYSFSTMILVLSLGYFCMHTDYGENEKHPCVRSFLMSIQFPQSPGSDSSFLIFALPLQCGRTQGNGLSIGGFWPLCDMGSFIGNLHKDYGPKKALFLKEDWTIAKFWEVNDV